MKFHFLVVRLAKIMQVIRHRRLLRAFLCHSVLAGVEHRQILTANLQTVVDVGANRGQFALASRRWAFKARVIAFEPIAEVALTFRKVLQGDPEVTLHQVAIGPETAEATIHVLAADDSSSLLPISPMLELIFPGTNEIRTEMVKVGPLADYVLSEEIVSPAMLKLDVQGYELQALRGCEELLDQFLYIYVECSFVELYTGQALVDDIIAWLRERGWRLSGVYNMTYDQKRRSIQADFLFENARISSAV